MSSSAGIGMGTVLKIGGFAIAEIKNISPSIDFDDIDVSDYDSGIWKEYKKGLGSCEVTADGNWRPDIHKTDVMAHLVNTTAQAYRVEWTDGTNWTFNGFLQGWDGNGPHEGALDMTLRIRVTGSQNYDA